MWFIHSCGFSVCNTPVCIQCKVFLLRNGCQTECKMSAITIEIYLECLLLFPLRLNKGGTLYKSYCFHKDCVHQSNNVFMLNIDGSLFRGQSNQSCGHCHRANFKPDLEAKCGYGGQHNEKPYAAHAY